MSQENAVVYFGCKELKSFEWAIKDYETVRVLKKFYENRFKYKESLSYWLISTK